MNIIRILARFTIIAFGILGALCSGAWLALYAYLFVGSVLHGEAGGFWEIFRRENNAMYTLFAVALLTLSFFLFKIAKRIR